MCCAKLWKSIPEQSLGCKTCCCTQKVCTAHVLAIEDCAIHWLNVRTSTRPLADLYPQGFKVIVNGIFWDAIDVLEISPLKHPLLKVMSQALVSHLSKETTHTNWCCPDARCLSNFSTSEGAGNYKNVIIL